MNHSSSLPRARTVLVVLGTTFLATASVARPAGLVWSQGALALVIEAGLSSALLTTVVLAINILFRRWLTARQMGLLWGLVLVRLLVPVGPSSTFSLQNIVKVLPSTWIGSRAHFEARTLDSRFADSNASLGNASQPDLLSADSPEDSLSDGAATAPLSSPSKRIFWQSTLILAWLWVFGATASVLSTTFAHWRFCRGLKRVPACDDLRLRRLWEESCRRVGSRRAIPIVTFDGVEQPAVLGLFQPKLLLPTTAKNLTDEQLLMVMLHELAHVERWHLAANWLLVVIRALHWWNPVCWLAVGRFESLREQACDAFAVSRLDGTATRRYGELLLTLAQQAPQWRVELPASLLGFFSPVRRLSRLMRTHCIRNRVRALHSAAVSGGRWQAAGVGVLVTLTGLCGLTDASPEDPPLSQSAVPEPSGSKEAPPVAPDASWVGSAFLAGDWKNAKIVARSYDVGKAIERINAIEPNEKTRTIVYGTVVMLLKGSAGRYLELANDRQWEKDHVTLDGDRLTVQAPLRVQDELARNIEAWKQAGLSQIVVGLRLIFEDRGPASRVFTGMDERMIVLKGKRVLELLTSTNADRSSAAISGPNVTTLNGQQASFACAIPGSSTTGTPSEIHITWRAVHDRDLKGIRIEGDLSVAIPAEDRPDIIRKIQVHIKGDHPGTRKTVTYDYVYVAPGDLAVPSGSPTSPSEAATAARHSETNSRDRGSSMRRGFSVDLQDGQGMLLRGVATRDSKRCFYVLLTARHIWPPLPNQPAPPAAK
jgi:beta-lactamase regulating signal transducer with metallopeptidase domain